MAIGSEDGARLETAFRRFEELPADGSFDDKRLLVREIVATLTRHAAGGAPGEHRTTEDAAARLQLFSPEAPGHDELVHELIDAARVHLADGHDHGRTRGPAAPAMPAAAAAGRDERVDEASDESFPASDPPSYAADPERDRS